jgi:hypothetical protein
MLRVTGSHLPHESYNCWNLVAISQAPPAPSRDAAIGVEQRVTVGNDVVQLQAHEVPRALLFRGSLSHEIMNDGQCEPESERRLSAGAATERAGASGHMWPVISSEDVSPFHTHPGNALLWYLCGGDGLLSSIKKATATNFDEEGGAPHGVCACRGNMRLIEDRARDETGYAGDLARAVRGRSLGRWYGGFR